MSKEEKSGASKFLVGAAIGVGLGMLFAPKKGSETRQELKQRFNDLIGNIKNIDQEELKEAFYDKVDDIKRELEDLDKEKALKLAKRKAEDIKDKCQDLVDMAIEKGTPILRDAAEEVRSKAIVVVKEILTKLEDYKEEQPTKKTNKIEKK